MITGFNTDVEFKGKIYHVQTEDTGRDHPTIVSILFHSGAILTKRKTSYADIIHSENLPSILKEKMNKQHKEMIRDLQAGKIELEVSKPASASKPDARPAAPARGEWPGTGSGEKKNLDDMILDYLSAREEHKKP